MAGGVRGRGSSALIGARGGARVMSGAMTGTYMWPLERPIHYKGDVVESLFDMAFLPLSLWPDKTDLIALTIIPFSILFSTNFTNLCYLLIILNLLPNFSLLTQIGQ